MSGSIHFFAEGTSMPTFKKKVARNWILNVIVSEQKKLGELNYIFVSDENLLETNKKYLDHDELTDVITFDNSEEAETIEGDIYISADRVKENARTFSSTFHVELHRVMIHGALHLCGFKDKTEKQSKEMRTKENEALRKLKEIQMELNVPRETAIGNV